MTTAEIINTIINGIVAFGTLAAVFLAVFGPTIQSWLFAPRLKLVIVPKGTPFPNRRICYFLQVVNTNPWSQVLATNCHVQVKHLWRRTADGDYVELPVPYPLTLYWPPSEFSPFAMTIRGEQRVDFGFVEPGYFFWPNVRVWPMGLDRQVRSERQMRFAIEVVSDEFVSPVPQVFEVLWEGEWSDDLDKVAANLQIWEANGPSKQTPPAAIAPPHPKVPVVISGSAATDADF